MGAKEAVQLVMDDHGDKIPFKGFRKDFYEDKPYKSFLQRTGKTLEEMLEMFKWEEDDIKFTDEYSKPEPEIEKLVRYRRCVNFDVGGWREIKEDFGRGDVSCIRDMRVPLVTSRSPLKAMKDEFDE